KAELLERLAAPPSVTPLLDKEQRDVVIPLPLGALAAQERVEVECDGEWLPAKILSVRGRGCNVRYASSGGLERDVPQSRIRIPDTWVKSGMLVESEFEDSWWPCRVLNVSSGSRTCAVLHTGDGKLETHVDIGSRIRETMSTVKDYEESRVDWYSLEKGHSLKGRVLAIWPSGCLVDVNAENCGWLPSSQVPPSTLRFGQSLDVEFLRVQEDGRVLVGKRRLYSEEDLEMKLQSLPMSEWIAGTVTGAKPFGIFMDVTLSGSRASRPATVHANEIREGYVGDATREVEVGQEVKVRVLQSDFVRGKLELICSMREDHSIRWRSRPEDLKAFTQLPRNAWLRGVVEYLASPKLGLVVGLEPPGGGRKAQGLVHCTCMLKGFVDDPAPVAKVGDEVKVRVLNVDVNGGRMLLTMKEGDD
ncbi:unnamed protein product, partial [Polarella glacialis]